MGTPVHDQPVRWALVGMGDIASKRVGPAIGASSNSMLYACMSRDPRAKRSQIEALQPQQVYSDFDRLLNDPNVDAVYLATPVFLHAPLTMRALEAGKDVLVEKPMALNAIQAEEMCGLAEQLGRRLSVAYYRRFWPRFQLVRDLLQQGDLGQTVLVRMALHSWFALGNQGGWRSDPGLAGGGVLSDVGSHRLDLLAWWFGLPEKLVADASTRVQEYEVEDSTAVLMILEGGVPCTASFQWNSKTWTDEIHVVGTEGKITLHPCDGEEVTITLGRDIEQRRVAKPDNAHGPLLEDFSKAILENRPPRFSGRDGIKANQIMDAIFQSSARARWVEIQ